MDLTSSRSLNSVIPVGRNGKGGSRGGAGGGRGPRGGVVGESRRPSGRTDPFL